MRSPALPEATGTLQFILRLLAGSPQLLSGPGQPGCAPAEVSLLGEGWMRGKAGCATRPGAWMPAPTCFIYSERSCASLGPCRLPGMREVQEERAPLVRPWGAFCLLHLPAVFSSTRRWPSAPALVLQISTTPGQAEMFTSHPSCRVLEEKTPPGAAWRLFTALVKQLIPTQGAKRAVPKPRACPSVFVAHLPVETLAGSQPQSPGSVGESSSRLRPRGRAPGREEMEENTQLAPGPRLSDVFSH